MAGNGAPVTFTRASDVLAERVHDETLIFDPGSHRSTRLNRSGSLLWEALREPCTVEALGDRLEGAFALEPAAARADAEAFLTELVSRELVSAEGR